MPKTRPHWMPPKPPTKREETRQRIEDCRRQARYIAELLARGDHQEAAASELKTLAVWLDCLAELIG